LVLLILSIALALVLALVATASREDFLATFAATALFIVWVSLSSALALCLLAKGLSRLSGTLQLVVGVGLVQFVTFAYSFLLIMAPESVRSISLPALFDPSFFLLRNMVISLVVSLLVFRHWSLLQSWQRQVATQSSAQLEALQARIRPHFLFNTLNTIASLIPERPVEAEQATMDLADLLRSGLKDEVNHSLGDELDLVRGYLRIESLRLGERLLVEWALDEDLPLQRPVPALLLQPLIENAIVHGVARRSNGGVLRIIGSKRRLGQVRFVIENPLADRSEPGPEGAHMALENIRQRLALTFGQGGHLKTESQDGLFRVTLDLPAVE
jgi:two-component system, LytTR family, sensor histidine kinase AlgZ